MNILRAPAKSTNSGMYTASLLWFNRAFCLRATMQPLVLIRSRSLAFAFSHLPSFPSSREVTGKTPSLFGQGLAFTHSKVCPSLVRDFPPIFNTVRDLPIFGQGLASDGQRSAGDLASFSSTRAGEPPRDDETISLCHLRQTFSGWHDG